MDSLPLDQLTISMQAYEKSAHFAQHFLLVGDEDVVFCVWHLDYTGLRNYFLKLLDSLPPKSLRDCIDILTRFSRFVIIALY
jgi:hypothetical protein